MAAAPPSASFFGIREEDLRNQMQQQQQQQQRSLSTTTSSAAAAAPPPAPPPKKKRNQPGTPNPDAEVIALSPKTLMATNRFICEVCNKGFQREQNLQLHRRGHNLPWKLRQKSTKEVRQRVYLCPEPTCVHHDPSRALGDLTGIKKHFCRKHGEKKWKCDKCSKRYAVQSDLKAHSKVCGTREYRCDCGTLFSRRDSFITHRAFCDALAQESARLPTGLNTGMGSHSFGSSSMGLGQSQVTTQISPLQEQSHASGDLLRLGGGGCAVQLDHLIPHQNPPSSYHPPQPDASSAFFLSQEFQEPQPHHGFLQSKPFHGLVQLPDLHNSATGSSSPAATTAATGLFNISAYSSNRTTSNLNSINSHLLMPDQFSNSVGSGTKPAALFVGNMVGDQMSSGGVSSLYNSSVQKEQVLPQMSATALLQKAAQMGATTSSSGSTMLRAYGNLPSRNSSKGGDFRVGYGDGNGGQSMRIQMENETHLQDLMNSLAHGGVGVFGGGPGGGGGAFGGVAPAAGTSTKLYSVGSTLISATWTQRPSCVIACRWVAAWEGQIG
ncbi:unnamed protein product [Spirodela intermedia]|uniref:Protein EARLY HEADING DATE 2 n=1 Tax=Spirodela intermedia TaxID=51605 RepID=A0A7I8J997_SPIIN|nr:unnamed protein product [Spirodela intermedia]CAA6666640.1 unnamed protein product [Spirodela intermedia]